MFGTTCGYAQLGAEGEEENWGTTGDSKVPSECLSSRLLLLSPIFSFWMEFLHTDIGCVPWENRPSDIYLECSSEQRLCRSKGSRLGWRKKSSGSVS